MKRKLRVGVIFLADLAGNSDDADKGSHGAAVGIEPDSLPLKRMTAQNLPCGPGNDKCVGDAVNYRPGPGFNVKRRGGKRGRLR